MAFKYPFPLKACTPIQKENKYEMRKGIQVKEKASAIVKTRQSVVGNPE